MKKRSIKTILAGFMSAAMLVTTMSGMTLTSFAQTGVIVNPTDSIASKTTGADLSISKTLSATSVDDQYKITFAMPATTEETEKTVAIVLVLDKSSSSQYGQVYRDAVKNMLTSIKTAAEDPNLTFNVGAVRFSSEVLDQTNGLLDISEQTNVDTINNIVSGSGGNGTSVEAGIRVGQQMLNSATANYKYMIVFSDYAGYVMANADGTPSSPVNNDYLNRSPQLKPYKDITKEDIAELIDNGMMPQNDGTYVPGDHFLTNHDDNPSTFTNATPNGFIKSIYWVGNELKDIRDSGVNVISIVDAYNPNSTTNLYYTNQSFQAWINENICPGDNFYDLYAGDSITDSFIKITAKILYQLGAGELTDTIGDAFNYTTDSASVIVDGVELAKTQIADNHWGYGEYVIGEGYPYEVTYDTTAKKFVWKTNKPVKVQESVLFSFNVDLDQNIVAGLTDNNYHITTNKDAEITYYNAVYDNGQITVSNTPNTITLNSPYLDYKKTTPVTPDADGYIHISKTWSDGTNHDPILVDILKNGTMIDTISIGDNGVWTKDYLVHTASNATVTTPSNAIATLSDAEDIATYSDADKDTTQDETEYADGVIANDLISVDGDTYTVQEHFYSGYNVYYTYDTENHSIEIYNAYRKSSSNSNSNSSVGGHAANPVIADTPVPEGPGTVVIDSEPVPQAAVLPKTGEARNYAFLYLLSSMALILAAGYTVLKKRQ